MNVIPVRVPNVLVVDDHGQTARLVSRLLEEHGCAVVTATSYQEALTVARSRDIDVLLSDIRLQDGDGCDLLAEIRSLHPVAAIALSGCVTAEDRARVRQAGFDIFLAKPVGVETLEDAIVEVLFSPQEK